MTLVDGDDRLLARVDADAAVCVAQAAGSDFTKTVNAVSAKLTLPAILAMNKAVIVDKKDPAAVAKQFLQANGLLM